MKRRHPILILILSCILYTHAVAQSIKNKPLVIAEQGGFAVGGTKENPLGSVMAFSL